MMNASIVDVLAIRAATKQICFLSIISSIYCDRISSADASEEWYAWIGGRPRETCVSTMAMIGKIYR